jgi:hypothetical protein
MKALTFEQIAQITHETNRTYRKLIGDTPMPPWENCPPEHHESLTTGVRVLSENREKSPEAMHEDWCSHKRQNGWSYGPVQDAYLKTHPCLVPFDQLPAEQRLKDYLFRGVVGMILCFQEDEEEARAEEEALKNDPTQLPEPVPVEGLTLQDPPGDEAAARVEEIPAADPEALNEAGPQA